MCIDLQDKGFKISRRYLYKLKKQVKDNRFHRLSLIAQSQFRDQHILSSTPNRPDGLMQSIEKDTSDKWTKLKLDYTVGLGTIYDSNEINKLKQSVEFPRE